MRTVRWTVLVLAALIGPWGCHAEVPLEPCGLAEVRDEGWVPPSSGTTAPLEPGEVRRVICVHGGLPCDGTAATPETTDRWVVRAYRDAYIDWVFYLVGVEPGEAQVRMTCPVHGERTFEVVVR